MAKVYSNLHVDGTFVYNNNPQDGYVLTTDSVGLVSWTSSTALISIASDTTFGHIKVGSGLTMSAAGYLSILNMSTGYSAGPGLTLSGTTFSVNIGDGLTMSAAGYISMGVTLSTNYTGGPGTLSGSSLNIPDYSMASITGNTLYVSPDGSDADLTRINHIGKITKPFLTLKAARDAAISGDTIYVHPQTFVFDNRNSNSNYWNTRINDLNLWKDGVSYYFSPGCKIIFYNQTSSGSLTGGYDMYLFRPAGVVFEKCNIFGSLEFECIGTGADNSNGNMILFSGSTIDTTDAGYTTYIQVKSITSNSNPAINILRGTTPTNKATVTIYADSYNHVYTSGQSGAGCSVFISGSAVSSMEYNQNIRYIFSQVSSAFNIRGDLSYTLFNIEGDSLFAPVSNVIFNVRPGSAVSTAYLNGQGIINVDIKRIYFTGPPQNIGAVVHNCDSSTISFLFNLKGDCIEYLGNGNAKTLFFITSGSVSPSGTASRVLNYEGNIYTITTSGESTQSLYSQGRRIAYVQGNNSVVNIKGNINYNGTLVTLREMFKTAYNGVLNYTGNIKGNFGCPITKCNSGEINISNSTIISDIDSSASSVISNGFNYINSQGGLTGNFELCRVKITNSYIKLRNSNNYIGNGGYIDSIISNSTIINSGTAGFGIINSAPYYADTMTNGWTTDSNSTGMLQMSNSSIIVGVTALSIYYTGTASVILTNSNTNADFQVDSGIKGSIDVITELKY